MLGILKQPTLRLDWLKVPLQGYGMGQSAKSASKKERMTEYLMAQMEHQKTKDAELQKVIQWKTDTAMAQEAANYLRKNIDMGADSFQTTGDTSMLNEVMANEKAAPIRKMYENQIKELGGTFNGITATPQGDLMAYGVKQDGTRVYGTPFGADKLYSKEYKAMQQAKQLEVQKAQADIGKTEAETSKLKAQAANGGREAKPMTTTAIKLQDEAISSLAQFNGVNAGY